MELTDIKKVQRVKLPSKDFKALYDLLKKDTENFSDDYLDLYEDEIKELLKVVEKYSPEAIKKTVVRVPREKTPKAPKVPVIDFDSDDVVAEVQRDYKLSKEQAVKLIALRKEAYELKKENIDKLLDRLDKSEFYQGKNYASKSRIDKGRTRDLDKDSKQGSITEAEERKTTGTKFKRFSKKGAKNQYGTSEGNNVYYEYRLNRRDVDNKIKLEKGGGIEIPNAEKRFRISIVFNDYDTNTSSIKSYFPMALNKAIAKQKAIFDFKQQFPNSKILKLTFKTKFDKGGSVSIPNAEKMFHLPMEIAIYVPSTKDVDKNITATELRTRVKEVEKYLAETFGGFTASEKVGGYLSSKSSVITEKVVPVTAFATTEAFTTNKSKLVNKMSVWAKKWGQEAIGFEFEGDLYYVPQKFKTGGTLKATYIPKSDIKMLTTVWGNNIKGKDLLDGAYTKRKNLKTAPKMARTMFEDEVYEYKKGGSLANMSYDKYVDYMFNQYKKQGYDTNEAYDTAFRDLGIELEGRFNKKSFDEMLMKRGASIKKAWNEFKKFAEIYVENGEYVNPFQVNIYAKGGKPAEPTVVRGFYDDEPYEYAKGGLLEHGLQIGDVITNFDKNTDTIQVKNDGIVYNVNLPTGTRRTSFSVKN